MQLTFGPMSGEAGDLKPVKAESGETAQDGRFLNALQEAQTAESSKSKVARGPQEGDLVEESEHLSESALANSQQANQVDEVSPQIREFTLQPETSAQSRQNPRSDLSDSLGQDGIKLGLSGQPLAPSINQKTLAAGSGVEEPAVSDNLDGNSIAGEPAAGGKDGLEGNNQKTPQDHPPLAQDLPKTGDAKSSQTVENDPGKPIELSDGEFDSKSDPSLELAPTRKATTETAKSDTADQTAQTTATTKPSAPQSAPLEEPSVPVLPDNGFAGGGFDQSGTESQDQGQQRQDQPQNTATPAESIGVSSEPVVEVKGAETSLVPEESKSKTIAPDELLQQVKLNIRTGSSRINFLVDPPELGRLDIQLVVKNGRLTGQISTESTEVQKVLQEALQGLKETMREAGIHVESIEIKTNDETSAQNHPDQAAFDGSRGSKSQRERNRQRDGETDVTTINENAESKTDLGTAADGSLNIIA